MKRLMLLLMLMSSAMFVSAGVQKGPMEPKASAPGMKMMMDNCPMNLPGTDVAVSDTATGIAVTVTTSRENVAELRRRVEQMAAMHSGRHSRADMKGQMMAGTVKYEAVENGARLALMPKEPATLTQFRTEVQVHLERMKKGECSMMHGMMPGMMDHKARPAAETKPGSPKDETDHRTLHLEGKP